MKRKKKMIWFTADTHFGHRMIPVYTKRRFCLTPEENEYLDQAWAENDGSFSTRDRHGWKPSWNAVAKMDDHLIDQINKNVKENDTLWHLGDFCFGPKSAMEEAAWKYRKRINCKTINFCWGNHDRREIASIFNRDYERYEFKHKGVIAVLSHYAQAVWNRSHSGAWMLYGHSHTSAEEWLDEAMPDRRSIDVGVDNAFKVLGDYRPFSFEELDGIMRQRSGCSVDHHRERTGKGIPGIARVN